MSKSQRTKGQCGEREFLKLLQSLLNDRHPGTTGRLVLKKDRWDISETLIGEGSGMSP